MRIAILGGAAAAARCVDIAAETEGVVVALVLADPSRDRGGTLMDAAAQIGAEALSCPDINAENALKALTAADIDILFSINNHQLILRPLLDSLPQGAVNMHQSLLPDYAGLNSCSWMILNGETRHGVTWHRMTAAVDGGPILAQESFPVSAGMTALAAILEVITTGTKLFRPLLVDLRDGTANELMQAREGSYYSARQVPFDGRFPLEADFKTLERLSRALNFHPLPMRFFEPRLSTVVGPVYVDSFHMKPAKHEKPVGLVLDSGPANALVAVRNGIADLVFTNQKLILPKGSRLEI